MTSAALGLFWGDDGYGLDEAVDGMAQRLAVDGNAEPGRRRLSGPATSPADIAELVATAPLFGGGTLVVVMDPYPLVRSEEGARAVEGVLDSVAPGNGLAFVAALERVTRTPPAYIAALRDTIVSRGGEARELRAPTEGRFAAWIEARATERGVRLGRGAAQALAARVGGSVREGDVDRRRMGQLAVAELEKLGLYRGAAEVSAGDVEALVAETVPASGWAFLDAVGDRNVRRAVGLLPAILETVPEPVVVAQLHRRIRELAIARDAASNDARPPQMMKLLGASNGFVVEKLVRQSSRWTARELEDALEGILDLDDRIKGTAPSTEAQLRLAFTLWLVACVGGVAVPVQNAVSARGG